MGLKARGWDSDPTTDLTAWHSCWAMGGCSRGKFSHGLDLLGVAELPKPPPRAPQTRDNPLATLTQSGLGTPPS